MVLIVTKSEAFDPVGVADSCADCSNENVEHSHLTSLSSFGPAVWLAFSGAHLRHARRTTGVHVKYSLLTLRMVKRFRESHDRSDREAIQSRKSYHAKLRT